MQRLPQNVYSKIVDMVLEEPTPSTTFLQLWRDCYHNGRARSSPACPVSAASIALPESGSADMTSLTRNVQDLPQELYDIIFDLVLAAPDEPEYIHIDKDYETPLALRLCHKTRTDTALHYFANHRFVVPRKRFLAWLLKLTAWHKQVIAVVALRTPDTMEFFSTLSASTYRAKATARRSATGFDVGSMRLTTNCWVFSHRKVTSVGNIRTFYTEGWCAPL